MKEGQCTEQHVVRANDARMSTPRVRRDIEEGAEIQSRVKERHSLRMASRDCSSASPISAEVPMCEPGIGRGDCL